MHYDELLFHLINGEWHNSFFDAVIPWIRNKYFWVPAYVFLMSFLLINFKKWGFFLIMAALVTITISDTVSSVYIKKTVQRVRPCHDAKMQDNIRVLVPCGGGYSFTSSHATNHFALAVFLMVTLGGLMKKYRWLLLLWAGMISYGQVYVGVHYPFDVLAGGVIGAAIGYFMGKVFFKRLMEYVYPGRGEPYH